MNKLKIFDLLVFIAFFISFSCLAVTVFIQKDIRKEVVKFNYQKSDIQNGFYSENGTADKNCNVVDHSDDLSELPACESESNSPEQQGGNDYSVEDVSYNNNTQDSENSDNNNSSKPNSVNKHVESPSNKTKSSITKQHETEKTTQIDSTLIVNINSKKIHSSSCSSGLRTKDENKIYISSSELQKYLDDGYTFCNRCHGYAED